jgi:hypothetical protein
MKKQSILILSLLLALVVSSCRLLNEKDREVVRVGEKRLMKSQVEAVADQFSGEDSLLVAESYVDQWIRCEVKLQEAAKVCADDMEEIDRMVEEYRRSLLIGRMEQSYLKGRLDTLITDSIVRAYFDSHRDEFVMDRTIVKGRIVRLPDSYRQSVKLFKLMGSSSSDSQKDFLDLCEKNNFELHTFENWVDFSEFLSYLPVRRDKNYDYMLPKRNIQEMADAENKYFIEIDAVLKKGEQAPFERVEDKVRRLLYSRQRGEILTAYNDSIYNAALLGGVIQVIEEKR